MTETILANATLVLEDEVLRGQLRLSEGMIADIAQGGTIPAGAVDCGGDLVLPGLVELHTDNLERHMEPRPKVNWPHLSAIIAHDAELASTGITTVFDALRVGSLVSGGKTNYGEYARAVANEILELRRDNALKISHFLHLRAEVCSETLVKELAAFGPEDQIGIVSLMDHTPGQRQFRDISKLKDYYTGKYGLSEADWIEHVTTQKALRSRLGDVHEAAVVAEARRFGAVLASHDDTTADQVRTSAAHGVHFAEFPTTVEAATACRAQGIKVMMGGPNLIRGGSHSGNVAAKDLAEAGLLDILSSDYVPSSLLSGALLLGDLWGDVARGIATVTTAPTRATGLDDRGALKVGLRADVIRVARVGRAAALRGVWVAGQRVS
ncbi:MAG: phosphonate metabolism protein PhnM [Rhodobacterales bacterium 12-65-15]|nr:MAG: phosphonate metabolism protein PhnM [Rhodobacterales bacterium 12-65-15]